VFIATLQAVLFHEELCNMSVITCWS